jgi:hypothetical protein
LPVVSRYCNICNRLITAREIESGEAIVYQTYYYCHKCKKEAMPIIEAIRRRQEREQEKEAKETGEKKRSSTRFGTAPKHRSSSSAHKLRKTRSGVFQSHPSKPQAPRKPHTGHRARADAQQERRIHKETKKPSAGEAAKPSFKPASEFDEAVGKASVSPAPPVKQGHELSPDSAPFDSEAIEIIGEPVGEEAADPEGMTIEEVIAAAEPAEGDSGTEDKLAASGITFEDVGPATADALVQEPAEPQHEKQAVAESAPQNEAREIAAEAEIASVGTETPAEKPAQPASAKPVPQETKTASKHAPSRSRTAISKFQKHVHPGKRHSALHPPEKKKPWLFIIVILLMALGGGGLIVYKQYFMPPEEESEDVKEEQEEKERYALLEKEISALVDKARTIAANPANFEEFSKKASELSSAVIPIKLREKLTKARDTAKEGFSAAAKEAFAKVKAGHEKAISEKDLSSALSALDDFPSFFKDTEYASTQIPALRAPIEKTLAVLEEFKTKKEEAAALEQQNRFAEAAQLVESISYNAAEVLPGFLGEISAEAARLRDLAAKEEERRAMEAGKLRSAFNLARQEARKLADEGKFQEAMKRLAQFNREYPGSDYQGEAMSLTEDILKEKRRAILKNFFNGKDLNDWTRQGEWKVDNSEIAAVSGKEKIWLLKGDPNWTDYTFEFDFNRKKGSLVVVLRTAAGEPESGFTQTLSERPFQRDTWYHVKCVVSGGLVSITTSFNNQEIRLPVKRDRGIAGFLLPPGSEVRIKNISVEVKEP